MDILWLDENENEDRIAFTMKSIRYHHRDWRFVIVGDPRVALRHLTTTRYDAVLSELSIHGSLPEIYEQDLREWYGDAPMIYHRGLTFWRAYRHPLIGPIHPASGKDIPLVFVSAAYHDGTMEEIASWSVPWAFVPKPVDTDRLLAVLEAIRAGDQPEDKWWRPTGSPWSSGVIPGKVVGGDGPSTLLLDVIRPKILEW